MSKGWGNKERERKRERERERERERKTEREDWEKNYAENKETTSMVWMMPRKKSCMKHCTLSLAHFPSRFSGAFAKLFYL